MAPHVTITHDALDLTVQDPLPIGTDIWWAEAYTVGKRLVRILLEYFLVVGKEFIGGVNKNSEV